MTGADKSFDQMTLEELRDEQSKFEKLLAQTATRGARAKVMDVLDLIMAEIIYRQKVTA